MGTLGRSHRVMYQSKNNLSGLSDVFARVFKPNGAQAGNYPLVELPTPAFAGLYYFDFITSVSDPLGVYLGQVTSPTEGVQAPFTIEYKDSILTNSQAVLTQLATVNPKGFIATAEVKLRKPISVMVGQGLVTAHIKKQQSVHASVASAGQISESVNTQIFIQNEVQNGM